MNKEQTQVVVLLVMLFIGLFVGTYTLLVKPVSGSKQKIEQQLADLQKQLKADRGKAKRKESLEDEVAVLNKKEEFYKKSVSSQSEFEFFRDTLRDMGSEYNVKVLQDSTRNVDENKRQFFKDNFSYMEKITKLKLKCLYHDFGSFINRIEATSDFRRVERIIIKKGQSSRSKKFLNIDLEILSLLKD